MFSSRCSSFDVPGIGSIAGERSSNQRIACRGGMPAPSGPHGRNAIPSRSAISSTSSDARLSGLYWFWTDAIGGDRLRPAQLLDGDVRQADQADLPLAAEVHERADRLLDRHVLVHAVQLVEVDPLQSQPREARVDRDAQVLGPPVARERVRAVVDEAALGADHKPVRVRVQRLGDPQLALEGPIDVCRVDEGHAELDDPAEDRVRLHAGNVHDPHGAEAEPAHLELAAEQQRVGQGSTPSSSSDWRSSSASR